MNRNRNFNKPHNLIHTEVNREVAIHEAGHAAAIYLGNKEKGLPPVCFRIFITPMNTDDRLSPFSDNGDAQYIANVDCGRLINRLPSSIDEATEGFSDDRKVAYQRAFEADIFNTLVGPLAEAKYIALNDGELINPRLVNLNALHHYGGSSDLESVYEYLECFHGDKIFMQEKLNQLFLAAFNFIDDWQNWRAITALADYIVNDDQNVIEFDEIIEVLNTAIQASVSRWGMIPFEAC